MRIRLALVEREGLQFGLVQVEDDLFGHPARCDQRHAFYEERIFREVPVVLVGDPTQDVPLLYGRTDLLERLEGVQFGQIEWSDLEFPD